MQETRPNRISGAIIAIAIIVSSLVCAPVHAQQSVLTFDAPQTAGISGFRAMWNTPVLLADNGAVADVDAGQFGKAPSAYWMPDAKARAGGSVPGGLVFDAIHRSLLVRFPGAAQKIAAALRGGQTVVKAELVLPFRATELWPEGYDQPAGMSFLGAQWATSHPRWHAEAWELRRPWIADPQSGPTYNAFINGTGYWAKYGAQDETEDRFPRVFGPAEVSDQNPDGRIDVTDAIDNPLYGPTIVDRLRKLEYCGFLVKKEEIYDVALWRGSYEWQNARGPQGILIHTPKLVVTLAPGAPQSIADEDVKLDFDSVTNHLKAGKRGSPTAVVPGEAQFNQLRDSLSFARPAGMQDWQWQRVQELDAMDSARDFPATYPAYLKWLDAQLARAPRSWYGFDAVDVTQSYLKYSAALPDPVKDAWKLYWWAWLMPDRSYPTFEYQGAQYNFAQGYIGGDAAQAYYQKTHDWRGNFSVYRTYAHDMGTMNFNHWNIAGVLLGGKILGSEALEREGRAGLEQWPLREWSWYDGSTQESIDHYYFAMSLTSQKVFADFGPAPMDRMMGRSMLGKSVGELAGAFHPGLRRFISSSGRTGIAELVCVQDGLQGIMDTLSRSGAYTDLGKTSITSTNVTNMPVIGHSFTPGEVAQQTINGPWAPDWYAGIVDDKPLPYEQICSYKKWGGFNDTPLWKLSYLGKNYGMASIDVASQETVPFMVQWRREAKTAESMTDLGTLLIRGGVKRTELLDSIYHGITNHNPNGTVGQQGTQLVTFQDKNRAIVLSSPLPGLPYDRGPLGDVTSIQTTVGLFNFQTTPTWELFVDGQKVSSFPFKAKFGSKITIHDGVTYLALTPISASNLGRDTEIEIVDDGVMTEMQGGGKAREALRINAYNYKSAAPIDKNRPDVDLAYGGYAVEVGDVDEYADFTSFQKHIDETNLVTIWDAAKKLLDVSYHTGQDTLHCVYNPAYNGGPTTGIFPVREVNGQWPYLLKGMERDSTLSQQGTTGILQKQGAILTSEPGHMTYLQTEPSSGTYEGFNAFSDATFWQMSVPGGMAVKADGRLGMCQVTMQPKENRVTVGYGVAEDQIKAPGMATSLLVFGDKAAPTVELNGAAIQPVAVTIDGAVAYAIPLNGAANANIGARFTQSEAAFDKLVTQKLDIANTTVTDWDVAGPFQMGANGPIDVYGPERDYLQGRANAAATYSGIGDRQVKWMPLPTSSKSDNGIVDLINVFKPNENVVIYAAAKIMSPIDQKVTVLAGADDTMTAWVNGTKVVDKLDPGGVVADSIHGTATLKKGVNKVLLKIGQYGGGWGFTFRVADEFGVPIDGLTYSPDP